MVNLPVKLLMGNEAIAYGALEAGVQVATAYPGTPASEIFSTLAELAKEYGFYAEWSVNEKVALEVAAGAAYAGARAIVSMKQVGLNVAADPLMTLAYIGVKGGLVLAVADDPGPHSSQNEQDTRKFAQFAKLPVLDPASPAEAKEMTKAAFELSEKLSLPVILRPTTRTCHVCQDVPVGERIPRQTRVYFQKDPGWTIMPGLAARRHPWLNAQQEKAREFFNGSPFNQAIIRNRVGIITSGVSFNYVQEALDLLEQEASILKIGTPYPLPDRVVLNFLGQVDRVLVVEEQEPVVEDQVIALAWKNKLGVTISGKHDCLVPREGEFDVDKVKDMLTTFFGLAPSVATRPQLPPLPLRTPVLCAGCPHRASFYAFKQAAAGQDAVFTGDIGCYTLGVIPPLNTVDTCLCMGASVTIATGLARVEPARKHVAFLGDSTFFHTGLPGLVNAVYNQADITLVVLDNRTTAMTGFQPHPGLGRTALDQVTKQLDIVKIAAACGVELVCEVDPYDLATAKQVARKAIAFPGPAVVIMKRECVHLVPKRSVFRVNVNNCVNCKICLEEFGCPAITLDGEQVMITDNCSGCGVCAQVCPVAAIEEVQL
ncbi:MAG: indolepyruvate ferredoxin oxidoreductase subunit alpha [Firmicutes bacterium]|nr:indolepyruvate ferredoxin oxidoreductase subunit alpha [Bacillota bacterium]